MYLFELKKIIGRLDNVKSLQAFQIMRFGAVILTNILLAKSILSIDDIGIYETLIFLGTGISFFWVSGLLKGMLTSYPKLNEQEKQEFFFNVFLVFLGMSLLVTSVFYCFEQSIINGLTNHKYLPFYNLLCLYVLLNTPTFLVEYIYLLTNQPRQIVSFGIYAFGMYVLVVILPVLFGFGVKGALLGLITLAITKLGWTIVLLTQYARFRFNWTILRPYLWLSFPLVLNILVAGGAEYIDGIIIHRFFDSETFAIFRYGARELPLALALTTAFSTAMIPVVAEDLKTGLQSIKEQSATFVRWLFIISIALMLLAPILFPIVFNPDFKGSALIFNIYLLLLCSRVLFPQTILIGQEKTGIILWVALIELCINVGVSLILVQTMGLAGVAWATVIAFAAEKIMMISYNYFKLNIPLSAYLNIKMYSIYSLLLIASFFLSLRLF